MKFIIKAFFTFSIFVALAQFLLLPGVIWNLLYPIILTSTIILGYLVWKKKVNKYLIYCFFGLTAIFILELTNKIVFEESLHDPVDPIVLKVMTYNLFFKNKRMSATINVIKLNAPDILFVQELTPTWATKLDDELKNIYKYKIVKALKGTHGIGVYSKYKLSNNKTLNNTSKKPYAHITDVVFGAKKIQLINMHLASPAIAVENKDEFIPLYLKNYKNRKKQLDEINDWADQNSSNYSAQLLVGDMNTMQYEPIFKSLKWNWVNTFSKSGSGFGFNFPHTNTIRPVLTLDYLLAKGNVECVESKVIKGGGSDHLAVMSIIKI